MAAVVSPVTFLKQARTELSKVVWPTRAETVKLTAVVIAVSAGMGLFISILDITFVKIMELLLQR